MKTIHFFGDSWTRGDGCQFKPGSGIINPTLKYGPDYSNEYNTFSFPAQLGNLLNNNVQIENNGHTGSSNFQIYRNVLDTLYKNNFKENDIVIIAWSSIVREPLNFLVTIEHQNNFWDAHGLNNSLKGQNNSKDIYIPSWIKRLIQPQSKQISKKIYEDYVVERMNLNLLYEICMNYICNLQIIFDEMGVNYIFLNAFENIVSNNIHFYNKINKNNWLLFNSTLSDYLSDLEDTLDFSNGYGVWEDDHIKPGRNGDGPHPNRIGYGYIAELLHKELLKRNLV